MVMIDQFSTCACPLTMLCNGVLIGNATSFFWRYLDRTYLFSNWHVFSGRDPESGQPRDQQYGAVPDHLRIDGVVRNDPNRKFSFTVKINDELGNPLWLQHKTYGQKVDIAALELNSVLNNCSDFSIFPCVNEMVQVLDMKPGIGDDIFVLGFPFNLLKTETFPVWKRASIATEPDYPVNNLPSFLVDTATRPGMSGAPVIRRASSYTTANGDQILGGPVRAHFLGIYSGRLIGQLEEAQLGIVWKRELIEQILSDPVAGTFILA